MNPVAAALTGWREEEARGRPLAEVFHIVNEETRRPVENPVAEVLREGLAVNLANHTLLIARDGRERPIADSGAPILDAAGDISGVVLVFRDQSEERAAQEAVRTESANLRAVMAALPVGLLVLDQAAEVVGANPAAEQLFGHILSELRERRQPGDMLGCVRSHDDPRGCGFAGQCSGCVLRAAIGMVFDHGTSLHDLETEGLYEREGAARHLWLRFSLEPVSLDGGPHALVALQDITEAKLTEQTLRQLASTLDESQSIARVGSYRYLISADHWAGSEIMDAILGIDEAYPRTIDGYLALVHPDDRLGLADHLRQGLAGLRPAKERAYRIIRRDDGEERWIHGRALLERDGNDRPLALLGTIQDITDAKRAEQALRESAVMLEEAQRMARVGSYRFQFNEDRWTSSDVMDEIFGIDTDYARTAAGWLGLVAPDDLSAMADYLREEIIGRGQPFDKEYRIVRHRDGAERWVHGRGRLQCDDSGAPMVLVGSIQDITERHWQDEQQEALQAQLAQSQKMESVGRLAGGVAHDFNNMLGVMLGHAEMALDAVPEGHPVHEDLIAIQGAAQRSADLTRQLLAFARRQTAAPRPLDLNGAVASALNMLRRLLGEEVDVTWRPGPDLWTVKADPAQIDQILANLCVNAKDAIDGVGQVTIATRNIDATAAEAAALEARDHVLLTVSDNGSGIEAAVLPHLFEPFFTTKEVGQGTGLGLSTVYGIVKQNDGVIRVESARGAGTTFHIYFPRAVAASPAAEPPAAALLPAGRGETILLVEDEPANLHMGRRILEKLGYRVLTAQSPSAALELAAREPRLHLLLTDVVMPEMHGRELAERVLGLRPGISCLYMSGYTADVIAHRGVLDEGVCFVGKPFTSAELAVKVREALDRDGAGRAA
jgi:PAS domain S-box-containing protein